MSQAESSNEATLFVRHLAGEDAAFVELFRRWNHKLYLYCLKIVNDTGCAEDVVQELWEKVIRLRVNQQKVDNPVGLLLKIAKNLCLNHIRTRRRETLLSSDSDLSMFQPHTATSDFEEAVRIALQSLSLEDREVLILNVYWGYSMQEIAVLTNKSTESVWKRASRARQRLRKSVLRIVNPPDLPAREDELTFRNR
jgi:RNA polymerase sigma factor (sigma-70 family)